MGRLERELTHLVRRRAQPIHLDTDGPVEPLAWSGYRILGFLNDEGPTRNGSLAARLRPDASTVSRHVGGLQQAGLIQREADRENGRPSCRG